MIGQTLFGYFFWRYLKIAGQFMLGVLIISYMIDFTEFARSEADALNYNIGLAVALSAIKMPYIVEIVIPFIILFASMTALVSFNRKYELVVARSSGISAWQFLAPICLGSFLIGVLSITLLNPLASHSFAYARQMEAHIRGNDVNPAADTVPWLTQRTDEGTTIIGAKNSAQRGLELSGVTLLRLTNDNELFQRIEAQRAELGDGYWQLSDAVVITPEGERERRASMRIESNLEPQFAQERFANPDTVSFYELPGMVAAARSFGLEANAFATRYYSLTAVPLLLTAMTLIAAAVSMRFVRMGQSASVILGGIMAGFLLYVVSVMVKALGSAGIMPPILAAWLPTVAAMFFGVTFLLFKEDG